jgi:transcriptional regulator with AAA-type ATPase domain
MTKFIRLKDDPKYGDPKVDINNLLKELETAKFPFKLPLELSNDFKLFIMTPEARERLVQIYTYFQLNLPILLEGQTGTGKRKSV